MDVGLAEPEVSIGDGGVTLVGGDGAEGASVRDSTPFAGAGAALGLEIFGAPSEEGVGWAGELAALGFLNWASDALTAPSARTRHSNETSRMTVRVRMWPPVEGHQPRSLADAPQSSFESDLRRLETEFTSPFPAGDVHETGSRPRCTVPVLCSN